MLVFSRKSTTGGYGVGGKKVLGGGLRMNRTMRMPTKGAGMTKEFYEKAETLEDPYKAYSPELVKKFEKVKIRSGKPKAYITF